MATEDASTFDLGAIEREMRSDPAYARGGHTARTLVHAPDLRVVLVVMHAGSRIAEHEAAGSATIHAITGHVRLHLPERTVELPAGSILSLPPARRHDVEAVADSALVVSFGWHRAP